MRETSCWFSQKIFKLVLLKHFTLYYLLNIDKPYFKQMVSQVYPAY